MVVGVLPDVTRAPTEGFFHTDLFLSWTVCLGYEKSREICVFEVINSSATSMCWRITLHYSVYIRTLGEKVRISDEAERVQSVSYSHKVIVRVIYSGVWESKRGTCLGPPFATQMCKVPCLQRGPTATVMYK